MFLFFAAAKVPCKHVIMTARSALADNPEGATRALRQFASLREKDAEDLAHAIFRKWALTASLPLKILDLGEGVRLPYLKFSDWVKYLLDNGWIGQLCGTDDIEMMKAILSEFWSRYRMVEPGCELWDLARANEIDLQLTLPVYSHSDEGRTLKKRPFWVLSVHGALGKGTAKSLKNAVPAPSVRESEMGLNFLGNSWGSQFTISVMTREFQNKNVGSLNKVMKLFAEDMRKLLTEGVCSTDGNLRVHCAHIGNKGDLPALMRLGNLQRNFLRCPRAAKSQKECIGICHLCLGGVEGPGNVPLYPW